jgi:hypothetical protein
VGRPGRDVGGVEIRFDQNILSLHDIRFEAFEDLLNAVFAVIRFRQDDRTLLLSHGPTSPPHSQSTSQNCGGDFHKFSAIDIHETNPGGSAMLFPSY